LKDGEKMRINNDSLIDSAQSLGADFTSEAYYLGHIINCSIQGVFTGTPDGTFTLECSNDFGASDKGAGGWSSAGVTNWDTITGSAYVVSAAGSITWDIQNAGYRWIRVKYTRVSSTGSLVTLRANAKGV
jgi:hypothetical protein